MLPGAVRRSKKPKMGPYQLTRAGEVREGLLSGQQEPGGVVDDAGHGHPDVDERAPELVVDRSGVLEPEDQDILGDQDGVEQEQHHGLADDLHHDVHEAEADRKWLGQVPDEETY